MADEEIKAKPKRVAVKEGDVFCAEFDNRFKCYFQNIVKDSTSLSGNVIRVFYKHYPIDYVPVIEDIVKDEVAFYTHTFIRFGLWYDAWYKIGKSKDTGIWDLDNVVFGLAQKSRFVNNRYINVDPLENWWVWKVNQPHSVVGRLPEEYHDIIEPGSVFPYTDIRRRMEYGYYGFSPEYKLIKRHPRPDADSYISYKHDGIVSYYHFKGEHAVKEIVVTDSETFRLTQDKPTVGQYHLYNRQFGDLDPSRTIFITPDEFTAVWNSATDSRVIEKF